MSKLKFKIVNFLVILIILLLNVGGCGGQPLGSKSILKVKKQMVGLSRKDTVPICYVPIVFLTFLSLLKNTF